ncbi:MAG: DUF6325 family protein [Microbacterium sp.]
MTTFTLGPVEFYLISLADSQPAEAVIDELHDVVTTGTVQLLDLVVISKSDAGDVTVTEIEADVDLGAPGLAGDDDIAEFAAVIEPGTTAALVALELTWAKRIAEKLAAAGSEVIGVERIPAPVVNALLESIEDDDITD